jgi:basic membrane protein A
VVLDTAGVDDRSFNAAAWAGLQRAQKELGLSPESVKYVESKGPQDYRSNLASLANQGYDIVFAVGYEMEDPLKEVAPQFPNVKFAIVDAPAPKSPNCAGLLFREQDGAFLAGYLAGSVTKTKHVGYVGGVKMAITERVEAGYEAGVKTANPAVKLSSSYTGDWNDTSKGRSQALQQFGSGADIILQGAGKSGLGVIQAAKEQPAGYYAIGTDQDQDGLAPGHVLTSLLKHTDVAVFDTVKELKEGAFKAGDDVFGVKDGGIAISEMKYTRSQIPADVLAKLDKIKQLMSDGKLTIPTTQAELASFKPPVL